jgi:hypothetical protein
MRDYDEYRRKLTGLKLPTKDVEFLVDVVRQYEEEIANQDREKPKPGTDDPAT